MTLSLNLTACGPLSVIDSLQAQNRLAKYRRDLALGFFETVIAQSKEILEKSETQPPADIALYALGEVYAHHAYAGKDYRLSKYYFERLVTNFPDSPLSWEAQTFVGIYNAFTDHEVALTREKSQHKEARVARDGLDKKHFEEAIRKNIIFLKQAGDGAPADMALYNLGLLYAHIKNPAQDFQKSRTYFEQLTKKFPASPLAEEARIWLGLFATIDKMRKIDQEIEKQKKGLIR